MPRLHRYPFPLWGDRFREPVFHERELPRIAHLTNSIRAEGAILLRTRSEAGVLRIVLQLPLEQREHICRRMREWPDDAPVPFLVGIARGADSHLVHVSGSNHAYAISLPNSQAAALGGSHLIVACGSGRARGRGNAGVVRTDGMVMHMTQEA